MAVAKYSIIQVRKLLAKVKDPSPLAAAMIEWYYSRSPAEQIAIEQAIISLLIVWEQRNYHRTHFGPTHALEILGAGLALSQGWRAPNGSHPIRIPGDGWALSPVSKAVVG